MYENINLKIANIFILSILYKKTQRTNFEIAKNKQMKSEENKKY